MLASCMRSLGCRWGRRSVSTYFDKCRATLPVSGHTFYDLKRLEDQRVARLPLCIRVLLEAAVRGCDGIAITPKDVDAILGFAVNAGRVDINWRPFRVIMQDLSGIPALVDLCAMRDSLLTHGGNPEKVNPMSPVDLVVDHSVIVDISRSPDALRRNMEIEFERNGERYQFLKWAEANVQNFKVVPPGRGIIHQVNCESIAQVVVLDRGLAFPDACVGTDSHTPMVNGIGVVGWGVGGIEAEAVMLGQPMSMVLPEVVGVELTGSLQSGVTATDLVLTVTQLLRRHGVVGKFVEFHGPSVGALAVTDRMTIANMCPEYGATIGFFPIDDLTLQYLRTTGRSDSQVHLIEEYCKAASLFGHGESVEKAYSSRVHLDLSTVVPCMAGPKRPQDRVALEDVKRDFTVSLRGQNGPKGFGLSEEAAAAPVTVGDVDMHHGTLAIAAITSCTNTSNPAVLLAAGLVAKKAVALGLRTPEHVKTSLAPGSLVVTKYLAAAGLQDSLDALGFYTVGYGCTTCMGNSGEVYPVMQAAADQGVITAAILSGNRNFEGRVHLSVKANYLASPPLVVAAAIAGRIDIDFDAEPLGHGTDGPVYLRDVWPSPKEVDDAIASFVKPSLFQQVYSDPDSNSAWDALKAPEGSTYAWDPQSTYITRPPFLDRRQTPIGEAYCLLLLGDSVTTDHISPVSVIKTGPAFDFLRQSGVKAKDMSSFGARRANADVMVRGTFANPRISNQLAAEPGPWTLHVPSGESMHVFEASERYRQEGHDLVVVAGREYGTGSSRDWAAKGTALLGVRAVLAESFERIHRSNLVGMGVLPLAFEGAKQVGLTGRERFTLDLPESPMPGDTVKVSASSSDGAVTSFPATVRLDTEMEVTYWKHGGIMQYVLSTLS